MVLLSVNDPTTGLTVKPGASLSSVITLTVLLLAPVKEESELGFTEAVIIVVWSPSKINSSTLSTTTRTGTVSYTHLTLPTTPYV